MTTSAKNYTKKKKKDRILGQMVIAKLYRQSHTKKHTHAHSEKERKEKNIYLKTKRKISTKSIKKSTNDNKL